jgi:flavin reductase (DIM6/NTAB) family NADH-FMN oxidoreductase RutF
MSDLEPRALRDAFGCFMTGVTVVTMIGSDGTPLGFTANSFSSVSLDPPLLLVSIARKSSNIAAFETASGFAVNILAEGQKDISANFARPVADRFSSVHWKLGPVGAPLIAGVSAWFDCRMEQTVDAGDHVILIGRVGGFEATPAPGLGYYRGAYVTPAQTAAQLPAGPDVVISAILESRGSILLTDDAGGGAALPMARVGHDGVQATLRQLIGKTGVDAVPGAIYAIYEDVARGTQHIAFRCPTKAGKPGAGRFVELSKSGVAEVADPAARIMLERLADESRVGDYGIYYGTHEQGHVTRISERKEA